MAAYKSAYQPYKSFTYGQGTPPIPPCLNHLASFIARCYKTNLATTTTRTIISALGFIFQLSSSQDLTQNFIIKRMLQSFLKTRHTNDPRLSITPEILSKLIQSLPCTIDSYFSRCLLKAMFIFAFCVFFRVGEITKTNSKLQHYLLFKHVSNSIDTNDVGFI